MVDHKVCELTKIIVNDGVTIIDGYVECDSKECRVYTSNDPANQEAKKKPYMLHNRVQFRQVKKIMPVKDVLVDKCFMSEDAMREYLTK